MVQEVPVAEELGDGIITPSEASLAQYPRDHRIDFISGDTLEDKSSPAEAGNFEDGAAVAKLIFKIMLPEVADEVDVNVLQWRGRYLENLLDIFSKNHVETSAETEANRRTEAFLEAGRNRNSASSFRLFHPTLPGRIWRIHGPRIILRSGSIPTMKRP